MSKLVQYITTTTDTKLEEYKQKLQQDMKKELAIEKHKLAELEQEYKQRHDTLLNQGVNQQVFTAKRDTAFQVGTYQTEQLAALWQQVTREYFADQKNLESWLAKEISQLPATKGVIKAGKSFQTVQKLIGQQQQSSLTVQQDPSLADEAGFVFESEDYLGDARLSAVLQVAYQQQLGTLYQTVFGEN